MQIIAKCPRCASSWLLQKSEADKRLRCPKCSLLFKVPAWNEVPKAVNVIIRAKGTIYVDEEGGTYG